MSKTAIEVAKELKLNNEEYYRILHKQKKMPGIKSISATATGRFSESQIVKVLVEKCGIDKDRILTGIISKDGELSPQIDIIVSKKVLNYQDENMLIQGSGVIDYRDVDAIIEIKNDYQSNNTGIAQLKRIRSNLPEIPAWIVWIGFRLKRNEDNLIKGVFEKCYQEPKIYGCIVFSRTKDDPFEKLKSFITFFNSLK